MNFVAGLLLLVAQGDEAAAFWMLAGLLERVRTPSFVFLTCTHRQASLLYGPPASRLSLFAIQRQCLDITPQIWRPSNGISEFWGF
jgi:hypothetical protein